MVNKLDLEQMRKFFLRSFVGGKQVYANQHVKRDRNIGQMLVATKECIFCNRRKLLFKNIYLPHNVEKSIFILWFTFRVKASSRSFANLEYLFSNKLHAKTISPQILEMDSVAGRKPKHCRTKQENEILDSKQQVIKDLVEMGANRFN